MAALETEAGLFFVVNNIPVKFRSADLRNYFSQFIESGGFLCFHYRHRPEVRVKPEKPSEEEEEKEEGEKQSEIKAEASCCCVVSVKDKEATRFVKMYSGNQWVDSQGNWLMKRCLIRRIKVSVHTGEFQSGY